MKSWCLFLLLVFFAGCATQKELPPPATETPYHLKQGIILSTDDQQQLLFQDGQLHELSFSVEPQLFAFSPTDSKLLFVHNDVKSSVYTFTLEEGERLLFSTRYPLVYAAFSPTGGEIAFVEHIEKNLGRDAFRLLLYSLKDGSLRSVAEDSAYPSWSSDGRLLLYSDLSVKESQDDGQGVFLYSAGKKSEEQEYVKVLDDALTGVFAGKNIYYLQKTPEGLRIRRYNPVTQKDDLVSDVLTAFDPSFVYTLQPSENAQQLLLHQTHKEGYTATYLVFLDGAQTPAEILSQAGNVLWYTENSLVFEPYVSDVFSQDKNLRTLQLENSATELLSPGLEAELLATHVGYHTDPFLFATLLLSDDL